MEISEFVKAFGDKCCHTFTVSESVYLDFQHCSGDHNALHTQESFAKAKGFKGLVMYGNILNAFVSYFVGECLPTNEVIIHSQDIAYKKPVFMNDELLFVAEIENVSESVKAIEFKFKFTNQDKVVVSKGHVQIGLI